MGFKNNSNNRFKNQYVGRLKYLFKITQLDNWVQGSTPNYSGSKVYTLNYFTNYDHPLSSKGKQQQWQNKHQPLYFLHFLISQLGHEYTGCLFLKLFTLVIYRKCEKPVLQKYGYQCLFNRPVIAFFTGYTLHLLYLSLL